MIRALGGDDLVEGGTDVDAGTGDDRVVFPRGAYDCGPGTDIVAATPRRAPVPDGCELVELDQSLTMEARPRVSGSLRVTLRTSCRCRYRGRLVVSDGGKVLARGRVDIPRVRRGVPIRATFTLALTRGAHASRGRGQRRR